MMELTPCPYMKNNDKTFNKIQRDLKGRSSYVHKILHVYLFATKLQRGFFIAYYSKVNKNIEHNGGYT